MPGSDVNVRTVEVAIESSAHSALTNLEKLAAQLDSLAGVIGKVVDKAGGLATIGKIDTGNIKDVLDSAKQLGKEFAKEKRPKIKMASIDEANKKLDELFEKAEGKTDITLPTTEKDMAFNLQIWERKLAQANDRYDELLKKGNIDVGSKEFRNATEQIVRYSNAIDIAKTALADWQKYDSGRETDSGSIQEGDFGQTNSDIAMNIPLAEDAREAAAAIEEEETVLENLNITISHHLNLIQHAKNFYNGLKEGIKVSTTAIHGFSKAVQTLANPLKLVSRAGQKFKEVLGIGGHGGLFGGRRTFGQFLGMMLLRRAIMSMIRALVSGIKEGSDNLAQYSADYNRSISSMSSALKYLKNAWAAAFAPIINVVAPYITAFINMLASALNAIGRFMAALTGKGFAVQAKPVWQDYADSLGGAASGAGKAAKAAKEYQKTLMSFDQIHALNSPDNSSSGGGGGGGGGGSDGLSVQDMFTTTSIEGSMKNFADKLREAAKAGNWVGVGEIIAEKLNEAFSDLTIWKNLGKKIADFFNIAIDTFYGFVKKFNFKQFGLALGTMLGTALANIHWDNLGGGIGRFATGLFEFLTGLMHGVDWKLLGKNIKTAIGAFFRELKWASIGEFVMTALESLLDFCIALMPDFGEVGDYILKAIGDFFDNVPESKVLAIAAKLALFLLKCVENMAKFQLGIPNKIIEAIFGVDVIDKAFGVVEGKLDSEIKGLESGKKKGLFGSGADWLFGKSNTMRQSVAEFFGSTNQGIAQYTPMLEGNMLQAGRGAWQAFTKWISEKNGKKTGTKTTTSIGNGVKRKSSWLTNTVGKVTNGVAKLFNIEKDTQKNAQKSVNKFGNTIKGMQSPLGTAVNVLLGGLAPKFDIGSKIAPYGASAITAFGNSASTKKDWVAQVMGTIATGSVGKLNVNNAASTHGANATTNFGSGMLGKQTIAKNNATTVANAAKNALDVKAAANTHGINIGAKFAEGINSKKGAATTAANNVANAVKTSLGSGYNQGYSLGQSVVNGINAGISSMKVAKLDYKINYTTVNGNRVATSMDPHKSYIKPYALGGFLNSGELFIARENGLTEMIGRIGNRGAVANNQQIVEGIEAGVAKGMMAALSATNTNANNIPYEINITVKTQNDEVLARAVDRGYAKRKYRLGTAMG